MTRPNGKLYIYGKAYDLDRLPGQPGHGRTIYLHRWLCGLEYGDRHRLVDHVDGDSLNNRATNLRVTDSIGNCRNRQLTDRPNGNNRRTGLRNVRRNASGGYDVVLCGVYLGHHKLLLAAKRAAASARAKHNTARLREAAADAAQQRHGTVGLMADQADRLRAAIRKGPALAAASLNQTVAAKEVA
jgi:hypothetical protein